MKWSLALLVLSLAWLCDGLDAAGPRINVVVGKQAPPLERLAASELSQQLQRLFAAQVELTDTLNNSQDPKILLGSPTTNPAIRQLNLAWPALTDQGHLLRSVAQGNTTHLIVGGGSPVATLWAAYELGHHWGIRYFLFGDEYPPQPPAFSLEGFDRVWEPLLRDRMWRTVNDLVIGPESWGLAEQQAVLRQLAKLKYNRILVAVYPWQPFVDFRFGSVTKQTGVLWYGAQFRVDGDTAGRKAFHGSKLFENPDFAGLSDYASRVQAGTRLVTGVIDTAHALGMQVGLSTSPLEFPREFAAELPQAKSMRGLADLTIGPGRAQAPNDALLLELVKAQLRAYIETYPGLDAIYLSMPEFPEWSEHFEVAWQQLAAENQLSSKVNLADLLAAARQRDLSAGGERGVTALRGNLVALAFFRTLLNDAQLLGKAGGGQVQPYLVDVDTALFPYLEQLLPPATGVLHVIDYTARRVAAHRDLLAAVPAKQVPSSLILTLADDNVGVLPQLAPQALHTLIGELRQRKWRGFATRYWTIGEQDWTTYYLSRASFDPEITPASALASLLDPVCGEGVAERTQLAFEQIERATNLIDEHDLGFSFPIANVIMKHYTATEEPPAWWSRVREEYLNAMNEMYRANTRAREGGRRFSLYLARRCEFGYEYMNVVEATRLAGLAKRAGDRDKQRAELERAVDSMYAALEALAAVARSNSDRGVIATLNEYGYRPLVKELAAVAGE